jgi:Na+/H+ antiporter NhaD/arsenite permease-like protein
MALLVVGQGMFHTGALDGPTRSLLSMFDVRPKLTIVALFALVFGVSAFINNTPVVVMFIPILGAIAARMGGSPSVFMMPLSFVCIFAGMTTLIGSSTNLLVADSAARAQRVRRWGFSNPPFPAWCCSGVGMIYIAFIMPKLLPQRAEYEDSEFKAELQGKQYIAQIEVTPDHPLVGAKPVAGHVH